jgi:tetratricopeptide (TPR) repeat protein
MRRITLFFIFLLILPAIALPARRAGGEQLRRQEHPRASDLMLRGNEQLTKKEFSNAFYTFQKALSLLDREGTPFERSLALCSKGEAFLGLREPQMAHVNMREALLVAEKLNDALLIAYIKGRMGRLFESLGIEDEALRLYRDAFRRWLEPDGVLGEGESAPLGPGSDRYQERLLAILIKQERYEEAYGISQRLKARPSSQTLERLAGMGKEGEAKSLMGEISRLTVKACDLGRQKRGSASYDAIGKLDATLARVKQELEKTRDALRAVSPQKAAIAAPRTLSLMDILFVQGRSEAILDICRKGDSSFLFLIDESHIRAWKLAGALERDIERACEKEESFIMIPDRMMAGLSPQYPNDGNGKRPLEERIILWAPSVGLWAAPFDKEPGNRSLMLLLEGMPDAGTADSIPPPAADNEIQALTPLYSPRVALKCSEVSPVSIDECLGRAQFVHCATTRASLFAGSSGLILEKSADHSGGARLFTLSLYGAPADNDDASGLRLFIDALFYSGTEAFLMNTQDIPENERIAFFKELYSALGSGASTRESFGRARQRLMRDFPEGKNWQKFIFMSRRTR